MTCHKQDAGHYPLCQKLNHLLETLWALSDISRYRVFYCGHSFGNNLLKRLINIGNTIQFCESIRLAKLYMYMICRRLKKLPRAKCWHKWKQPWFKMPRKHIVSYTSSRLNFLFFSFFIEIIYIYIYIYIYHIAQWHDGTYK